MTPVENEDQAEDDSGAFGDKTFDQEKPDEPELAQANATADNQEGANGNPEEEQKQETAAYPTATAPVEPKDPKKDDSEIVPAMTEAPPTTADNQIEQDDGNNNSKPVEANLEEYRRAN